MNQKSVLLRQKQQEKIKVKMLGEKRKATAIAFLTEKSLIEFVKAFIWQHWQSAERWCTMYIKKRSGQWRNQI